MKYSAVIFDWDGTLGMTLHIWMDAYKSGLKNLGIELPDEVIIRDFFYEHNKTAAKYPNIDIDLYVENVRKYMVSHVPFMKLYEGVHETLEKLQKNNITLTLVSSSPRKLIEEVLELTELTKYFKAISGFDDIMKHKPDPAPFLYIIEVAKLDPKTTIIIGDSPHDITAAKAAGLDSCLFLPSDNKIFYDFDQILKTNPNYSVQSLEAFAELILNS
ncbi:MAG: HAD family hydrolase [Candidatus Paceibacterota bacterium]